MEGALIFGMTELLQVVTSDTMSCNLDLDLRRMSRAPGGCVRLS